ncbi:MAG: amidohydrolase family protein [Clostridiales bacterium]|nr:amidohydrolase family protein [Clostridiales bacterium]
MIKRSEVINEFYDVHMHAYNLSHPSLALIMMRIVKEMFGNKSEKEKEKWKDVMRLLLEFIYKKNPIVRTFQVVFLLLVFLFIPIAIFNISHYIFAFTGNILSILIASIILVIIICCITILMRNKLHKSFRFVSHALNVLFLMDYSLDEYFLTIESEIKDNDIFKDKDVNITLCPQMMDFSGIDDSVSHMIWDKDIFEKPKYLPRNKPFIDQEIDLMKGIQNYYYEKNNSGEKKLLTILPFRGFEITEQMTISKLNIILDKHFEDLPQGKDNREKAIYNAIVNYNMNENIGLSRGNYSGSTEKCYIYAGFKVYPPLGFEVWPENSPKQRMMVKFYKTCIKNNIPIMIHCGSNVAGTVVNNDYLELTKPMQWDNVFDNKEYNFKKLKICFAHFGVNKFEYLKETFDPDNDWKHKIIEMCIQYENVYVDISCRGTVAEVYFEIDMYIQSILKDPFAIDKINSKLIGKTMSSKQMIEKLLSRILFGTDFPMCCFTVNSYSKYLDELDKGINSNNPIMNNEMYQMMTRDNCKRFLFGD